METKGLLTVLDIPALVQWCEDLGAAWRARKQQKRIELATGGEFLPGKGGAMDPCYLREKWAFERAKVGERSFGGSPEARTKIAVASAQLDMWTETAAEGGLVSVLARIGQCGRDAA